MACGDRVFLCVAAVLLLVRFSESAQVTGINPSTGSTNGATKLSISGNGFSKNEFSFGGSVSTTPVGNKVTLVSGAQQFDCPVFIDGTHETQILCITEPMPEGEYEIKLSVDGDEIDVCRGCTFTTKDANTPTITNIEPRYGAVGTIVKITGKIFTDIFTSSNASATNGQQASIRRVYVGESLCELEINNSNDLHGIQVDSSNNGFIKCRIPETGPKIGNINASFLISHEYGRSLPNSDLYRVSHNGQIHMFQTYAEVTSVSPSSGSVMGGTLLSINGHSFDRNSTVSVDGAPCTVKSVTNTLITCETAAKPTQTPQIHAGNRGLKVEIWNATTKTQALLSEVGSLNSSAADYFTDFSDEAYYFDDTMDNMVTKMSGFYVAPYDGMYSFHIMADDGAELYLSTDDNPANLERIAYAGLTSNYHTASSQSSAWKTLVKDNKYYMEVYHREVGNNAYAKVSARYYNTTEKRHSIPERQKVEVTSVVAQEKQNITFSGFTAGSATSTVQTVTVEKKVAGSEGGTYRLSLYGVATAEIEFIEDNADAVATAVNNLAVFDDGETVSVTEAASTGGLEYTITFTSDRGDFPLFQYEASDLLTVTVAKTTTGTPSGTKVALAIAGVPAPLVSPDALPAEIQSSLDNVFGTRCPSFISSPAGKKVHHTFESSSDTPSHNRWKRYSETEAFCGKYVVKNPTYLFKTDQNTDSLQVTGLKLCFAHKGDINTKLRVSYTYTDQQSEKKDAVSDLLNAITTTTNTEWEYNCVDLSTALSSKISGGSNFFLHYARMYRTGDVYVDEVYLGTRVPTTDAEIYKQRLKGALLNGYRMDRLTVTGLPGSYLVTLYPFDCGNGFPLFTHESGQLKSGAEVKVTRVQAATPPIGGTFALTFLGQKTPDLSVTVETEALETYLEAINGVDDVTIIKEGDCSNFNWFITYNSLAGDQSLIQAHTESLTGPSVSMIPRDEVHGHLLFDPIFGENLRFPADQPQVAVTVNDVTSKCSGSCSFEWLQSSTPSVTGITPATGQQGTVATITGTGFSSTASDNSVMVGGVACSVTTASSTSITCTVGNGLEGIHKVSVSVTGYGLAQHSSGDVQYIYTTGITSFSPASSSLGGGVNMTVDGYGFRSDATVTIDGQNCPVIANSPDQLVCVIPAKTSAGTVSVAVLMTGVDTSTASSSFTYESSITAQISSVTPTTSGVQGGTALTVTGSGFGTSGTLIIGGTVVPTSSFTDTQVTATLPPLTPGTHAVQLIVGTDGAAVLASTSAVPTIDYVMRVTNVYPLQGSLHGGTKVTITGDGLAADAEVKFGDTPCNVDNATATSTQIVCTIGHTGTTHQVDNQGKDRVHGTGYAWNPKNIDVELGDTVRWQWFYPSYVTGQEPRLEQTPNASATTHQPDGFISGLEGTKSGVFEFQFNTPGKNYYWSGYVNEYLTASFRGAVNVVNKNSYVADMTLKLGGFEATYDKTSGVSNPTSSGPCIPTLSAISGCSDPAPTGGDAAKFNFKFWSCLTPTITAVDKQNGTAQDDITIDGTGISSTTCHNEVFFGRDACLISAATASTITCKLDSSLSPPIGVQQSVSMRVGNLGYARVAIAGQRTRTFAAIPVVTGFSPSMGSLEGNTVLSINGAGFQGSDADLDVRIADNPCTVLSQNYTTIVCSTPKSSTEGAKLLTVKVKAGGQMVPAECQSCDFTYDPGSTPTVTSVSPSTLDGSSTTLTIQGSRFGSSTTALSVTVGGEACDVTEATGTTVKCTIAAIKVGSQPLVVDVAQNGRAKHEGSPVKVTGQAHIISVSPSSGSTNGGTKVSITGNGFIDTATVTIDGQNCPVESVTLAKIVCTTTAHAAADNRELVVTSDGTTYSAEMFNYTTAATPEIASVSPTSGTAGQNVIIGGTNFGATIPENSVTLGGRECVVTAATTSQITCTVGNYQSGSYSFLVYVDGKGNSNNDKMFTFDMTATDISPNAGSTSGDQTVTISGSGFDNTTSVTICSKPCLQSTQYNSTETQIVCVTPAATGTATVDCEVSVVVNSVTRVLSYKYDSALTPEVTAVAPSLGGTGGGTRITVSGLGFGTTKSDVAVSIEGSVCVVDSVTDTQIVCDTGSIAASVRGKVRVEIAGNGKAIQTGADYHYVDRWSSIYTWGGTTLPTDGDLVVIKEGQTIYLDTSTAKLKLLLIQGGEMIFDDNQDVTLDVEIVLVTDGGLLQVGTRENPFRHNALILLRGTHRSKELPIYGTKAVAVREGTLDMHGIPTPITWTRLAETANAGTNILKLKTPVNWRTGDNIAIASTGGHASQSENEYHTITSIAGDNRTLTLESNLAYNHIAVTESFGTGPNAATLEFAAEVGLLSHNVRVEGYSDPQWVEDIEACPDGFDTGEFAVQTCFQGRFGQEMGSDEFGGQIIIHKPNQDLNTTIARLSYIELKHMGQAFRLGRYPVHFHLNGDMSDSYVIGLGIHETFNRAVNIHGTYQLRVEHTVIYNIMGGAFFLEDGIESGNTIQYNLAIFVRPSNSLLNDDVTPAAFWCTNPNNTIRHNAAAGGSHFGFWYRMHDNPEGPSFTTEICPKVMTLAEFRNNSAHSLGWFGLWIFPTYTPRERGECGSSNPTPARFEDFFAWNCEKGAETVNTGQLQFIRFILVANQKAGFEGKLMFEGEALAGSDPSNESAIIDSLIVGHTSFNSFCTIGGIVFPYGFGFRVTNVELVNFNRDTCACLTWTRIDGTCSDQCAGFTYKTSGLIFTTSPNRVRYAWIFEGVLHDLDGSLCGSVGCKVVPETETLPHYCTAFSHSVGKINASVCASTVSFRRFGFNNILPSSLEFKQLNLTNQYGLSLGEFRDKRITHKMGWVVLLVLGETYDLSFVNSPTQTNLSFSGTLYHFESNDHVFFRLPMAKKPDRLKSSGRGFVDPIVGSLDPNTHSNGDWTYDHYENKATILVKGSENTARRKKRAAGSMSTAGSTAMGFQAFKCFYANCTPPPDPNTVPPVNERPSDFVYWSNPTSWTWLNNTLPVTDTDLTIPKDVWMVADMAIPSFNKVFLYGALEFDHGSSAPYRDIDLNATHIIILGGRLVIGWPDAPYLGNSQVILRGDWNTPDFTDYPNAPAIGSKVIAVFGGLDLHGKDMGVYWTRLASTAVAGDNTITLAEAVNWTAGSEIVLAPTGYDAWETEIFKIISVSSDKITLTLNTTLSYRHVVHTETLGSKSISLGAEVGLLTRNVKVIGEWYPKLIQESFGARILVGTAQHGGSQYTGFARVDNVEFFRSGQEGYTEFYDPRYSIAFLDTGTVNHIKPSYIRQCAFHDGFGPAVGSFAAHNLTVEDNVIHHTVWWAIEIRSDYNQLRRNLVVLVIWEGSYLDREETNNFRHNGAFQATEAKWIIIDGNVVAGAERAGYRLNAEACDSSGYGSNMAHTCLMGIGIYPEDALTVSCVLISNFTIWKCRDVGMYYQNAFSVEFRNNILVENTVGSVALVVGPSTVSHLYANKYVLYKDSWVVGATTSFDCTADALKSDENIRFSSQARTWVDQSHVGIGGTIFTQASNNMPKKPHLGEMAYNAIAGVTRIEGIHFGHFKSTCGKNDFAFTTTAKGDDLQHPIESKNIQFTDVLKSNKIHIQRPNVGKINSADCVDMDCDGLKKNCFVDEDGTFLDGNPGAIISQSEWQWNGDPRRGLGDYRIPKEMLTTLDGTRIPVNDIAPHKGIIRNAQCELNSVWQAYECHNLNYKMLIIESMDADTETRRVSPVAILGDGYLDLINGPQDHGWCSGYTCRKRVSTFAAIVAMGKEYLIHFTGTTPQHLRFLLLNSNETDSIKLAVWYSQQFRLDVFVDGNFIAPENSRTENGKYILDPPQYEGHYMPNASLSSGESYQDRDSGLLHFTLRGNKPLEIKTIPSVIVSFLLPPMTVDEFFGENLIHNLANFFDIDPSKVRIVKIVSEASKRRRKRSTGNSEVVVEVADVPNSNVNDSSDLSLEQLRNISTSLINEGQIGNLSEVLNTTITGVAVVEPPATPGTPEWNSTTNESPYTIIIQAADMRFNPAPEPQHEGVVFKTQPKIQVLDAQGQPITQLGTAEQPWQITASLRPGGSNPLANLIGNLTVEFVNGWANFTDLLITQFGTDFYIDFDLTVPADSNFSISSAPLTVTGRPIEPSIISMTSNVLEGNYFSIGVELRDGVSSEIIPDIAWRGHTWTMAASLNHPEHHTGSMLGSTETVFSTSSSSAHFYSLNFTSFGIYALKLHIYTTPAAYDLYKEVQVLVKSQEQTSIVIEQTSPVVMKFESANYAEVVGNDSQAFAAMMANRFIVMFSNLIFNSVAITEGSIIVTYSVSGSISDVNTTVYTMCESIQNGSTFNFNSQSLTLSGYLTVGGVAYYGVHCGPISTTTTPDSDTNETQLALIIALVVVSVLLIIAILAIVLWKCKVYPKTKTRDLTKYEGYLEQPKTIEDILFREQSFMSIREKSAGIPQAPAATNLGYNQGTKSPLPF
ncbi:fibrocystin-L-like [Argopecten irradians]|uniref:fibrocystin-L-like n=1 Tax=Argopecten irradians TaxID=31199 RepID=UPI0037122A01